MKKVMLHRFTILERWQKHAFQLVLPSDATRTTGPLATPSSGIIGLLGELDELVGYPSHAGRLSLNLPDERGLFFSEAVTSPMLNTDQSALSGIPQQSFANNQPWVDSNHKAAPLNLSIPPTATMIDGFYEDELGDHLEPIGRYRVNIYLYYEINDKITCPSNCEEGC